MMTVSMPRLALVLGIVAMATTAQARTATGYSHGEKTKIKIVECGNSEAEVHTAIAFRAMARAASKAGLDLRIRSGFRSYAKQKRLYKKYQRGEGNLAARPGYSNHESGRALDIYITDYRVLEWLTKHAAEYGFHRTVPGEAWHWEYLGGYEPKAKRSARRDKHVG
jgi:LAS superfamily LD-carboxypeptidase LdcB